MAVGERCPACGHMPGEDVDPEPVAMPFEPFDHELSYAVQLTQASTTPGHTGEEIAARLQLLYRTIKELTGAAPPADPAA